MTEYFFNDIFVLPDDALVCVIAEAVDRFEHSWDFPHPIAYPEEFKKMVIEKINCRIKFRGQLGLDEWSEDCGGCEYLIAKAFLDGANIDSKDYLKNNSCGF